jgi:hypothetical protein
MRDRTGSVPEYNRRPVFFFFFFFSCLRRSVDYVRMHITVPRLDLSSHDFCKDADILRAQDSLLFGLATPTRIVTKPNSVTSDPWIQGYRYFDA